MANAMQRSRRFSLYFPNLDNFLLALRGTRRLSIGILKFYYGLLHGEVGAGAVPKSHFKIFPYQCLQFQWGSMLFFLAAFLSAHSPFTMTKKLQREVSVSSGQSYEVHKKICDPMFITKCLRW